MTAPSTSGPALGAPPQALDVAGIEMPEAEEDEVEKFREFLDSVSPEYFRGADT